MTLQVYQIDAWRYDDGWTYNNSIPICKVEVKDQPTKIKILKALRAKGLLRIENRYIVDDYFVDQGTWCVQLRKDGMPLYDLQEEA